MRTWTTTIISGHPGYWLGPGAWAGTVDIPPTAATAAATAEAVDAVLDYVETIMLLTERDNGIRLSRPPVVWLDADVASGRNWIRFASRETVGTEG